MKNFKFISFMAVVLAIGIALSACGTGADVEGNNTAADSSSSLAPDVTGTKAEPVELVVWVGGTLLGDDDIAKTKSEDIIGTAATTVQIKEAFQNKYPNVTLKFEYHGWAEELTANLMRAVMGGVGPDVVQGESQVYELAKIGGFKELNIEDIRDEIVPGTLEVAIYNDKVYGVPFRTGVFGLIYNKDVLQKSGYDPEKDIPTTWDQLLEMSQDITAKGKGEYYGFMIDAVPGAGSMFRLLPWILQAGGSVGTLDGDVTFNNPANVKALEFARELAKTAPKGAAAITDEWDALKVVQEGLAAFQVNGPWEIDWQKTMKSNCGYARLPVPEEGQTGNAIVSNIVHSVLKNSKHPAEAEAFVKFCASKEGQKIIMSNESIIPVNKTMLDEVPDYLTRNPDLKPFIDELNEAKVLAPLPSYKKNSSQVMDQWTELKNVIFDPSKDLQAGIEKAQQEAENAMK